MQLIQVNFVWTYLTNEDYRWNQLKYLHISDVMWCDQFDLHLLQSIFKLSYKSFDWRLTFAFFLQKKGKKCLMCLMWPVTSISSRIPSFSSSTSNGCTVYCDFNRHLECCKYLEMIIDCFYRFHLHLDCALFPSYYIVVDICYQGNLLSLPKISNDQW